MKRSELAAFQKTLLALRQEAAGKTAVEVTPADEIKGDDVDINSQNMEDDMKLKFSSRNVQLIKDIDLALKRIADGSFGLCEECEDDIGKKRLAARPTTGLCINCKEQQEREQATHARNT
jgi:DnaK suppressor protein